MKDQGFKEEGKTVLVGVITAALVEMVIWGISELKDEVKRRRVCNCEECQLERLERNECE